MPQAKATPAVADDKLRLFEQLFEADKNRLYAYIFAFVSNSAAADDIFQETSLTLWHQFDKFELGTNFSKWANTIAFNRVLTFRTKHKKYQLGLNEDLLKELSDNLAVIESNAIQQEQKWHHLDNCRATLSSPLNNIYQRFYVENKTAKEVAEITGRSFYAVRKAVHKLRRKLIDCVDLKTKGDRHESQ
ncbi:sigma-70 family RNA polymerase sigma factor [Neiella sp. HB171785]|uniref:Sigma-70 family RNA polymerase sigma factor n=1 Tax=Neiella litorisoli TaxID=2771431 RepID=A0A8J6UJK1_9GAMM|nr:sigma-70 family RNA polymerase sigma factor [Neiella litorisoli]MBD1390753.1 sigma-70 family RNA polymerase sigma factor [Neiella litorisoli]